MEITTNSDKPKIQPPDPLEGSILDWIDVNVSQEYEPGVSLEWLDAAKRSFHRGREYLARGGGTIGALSIGAIGNPETLGSTIKSLQEILGRDLLDVTQLSPNDMEKITPKEAAIISIDDAVWFLDCEIKAQRFTAWTVATALGIGAALMRLAIDDPQSELFSWLKKVTRINISKEAERGIERVIRKREKKRQDGRKSRVEAKRKAAAIAMMKKLIPMYGQVEASYKVIERMNKRNKVLDVRASTVRRWYNTAQEIEEEARKVAAVARQGRSPS